MATVAVVGLGAMGRRVAARLLAAGNDVVVWNRDRSKADELVDEGAVEAETPADAARRADAVITMVTDPAALQAVTEGDEGVVRGVDGRTTVIQMSTVGPAAVERLASLLPDESLLDAPVLGSLSEVESGTLNVFVGGPQALVERWRPLLSQLGSVLHVGDVGAGSAAKLVANTTLIGVIGVLGEALALAQGLGLPREAAFRVLGVTALGEQAARRRPAVESGDYPPRFSLALARKDADLILAAAAASGTDLRLTKAAREWLVDAERDGWGAADYSAVLARMLEPTTDESQPASSSR